MDNRTKIINILETNLLCDDCLSDQSGVQPRQSVNIICRQMKDEGFVSRIRGRCPSCGSVKIVNRLLGADLPLAKPVHLGKPANKPWYWEGNVQNSIVEHLKNHGYTILREADTLSREAGVDIEAIGPKGKRLLVSVKGFPTSSKNVQARHWFAGAIFDIILYRQEYPEVDLAIGLPAGFVTYENLVSRVSWLKENAPFQIYWVKEGGLVSLE